MKFTNIQISNFRGISSLEVKFIAPGTTTAVDVAVFAGPNGCGKTSVLEACLICLDRTDLMPEQRVYTKHNVRSGTAGFLLKANIEDGPGKQSVEIQSNGLGSYEMRPRLHAPQIVYFSSWREPRLVGPVAITAGKPKKKPKVTEENRLWRIKNYLINLRARRSFEESDGGPVSTNQEDKAFLDQLNNAWRMFYPQRKDRFEAFIASENVEEGFDLFLLCDNLRLPVDSLSSGELEVLVFIGSLLIENFKGGIILIDEPELHLHPAWHRVMLRAIRTLLPNTQIICATHSAEVLDSVASYERFLLLDQSDPRVRNAKSDAK
jgi:energy-coupling factor transporter ATP-binding protein EcfA2